MIARLLYGFSPPLRFALKAFFLIFDSCFLYPFDTVILTYHSVSTISTSKLELQLSKDVFSTHLRYLLKHYTIVDITTAAHNLAARRKGKVKYISIMFDDGYYDFYSNVLPLFEAYDIPVSLAPALQFIEDHSSLPIKKELTSFSTLLPLDNILLERLSKNKLVTLVSHGYSHIDYSCASKEKIKTDIGKSDDYFSQILLRPLSFCFPMGRFSFHAVKLLSQRFSYLFIGPLLSFHSYDKFLIPRIPILKSDYFFHFKQRCSGRLFRDTLIIPFVFRLFAR